VIAHLYSGERRIDAIDPRDRGLAYGDGLFETILVHRGQAVWWSAHLERLARGCGVLGIAMPDPGFLRIEADAIAAGCARGVLKLIVTRGASARGYATAHGVPPTLVLTLSDPPHPAPAGLNVRWCDTPLAIQPRLAGIKHLNRLEQVLARAEWSGADVHEGLQCDTRGRVVAATAANLFVLRDGRWRTPPVADCGIAGTCRAWWLGHVGAVVESLDRNAVESAQAVVLCNAVRGILPVAALGARRWLPGHPRIVDVRRQLAEAEPAFERQDPASGPEEA